jgi:hypothetical protein
MMMLKNCIRPTRRCQQKKKTKELYYSYMTMSTKILVVIIILLLALLEIVDTLLHQKFVQLNPAYGLLPSSTLSFPFEMLRKGD